MKKIVIMVNVNEGREEEFAQDFEQFMAGESDDSIVDHANSYSLVQFPFRKRRRKENEKRSHPSFR